MVESQNGKNAMHWAAEFGHLNTLKLLCDHFAVWTDADKVCMNFMTLKISSARSSHFWLA